MALKKPYYGIYRPFITKKGLREYDYLTEVDFFVSKGQHIMAYYMIAEDIKKVFEYIEPVPAHGKVYSHRLFELLLRTCTEIESIFTELLAQHEYKKQKGMSKNDNLNMKHYFELEKYMRLSQYTVAFRTFTITPYAEWQGIGYKALKWYKDYNNVKHSRFNQFKYSSLKNVMEAFSGLYILLYSQFDFYADAPYQDAGITAFEYDEGYILGNLAYSKLFSIENKPKWTDTEKYDFDWATMKNNDDSFQKILF